MNWRINESGVSATIENIEWERIHLILTVRLHIDGQKTYDIDKMEFYAVNNFGGCGVKFDVRRKEDIIKLHVNVTNSGDLRCIPRGTYRIFVCEKDCVLAECETSPDIADQLEAMSRNFLYGERGKSYNVTFYIEDGTDTLPFRMHCIALGAVGVTFPQNPSFLKKINLIKALKDCYLSSRSVLRRVYKWYSFLYKSRRKNTVLFMTEQDQKIASNLKAVSDRMVDRQLDQQYRLLYSARPAAAEPQSKKSWIGLMKLLAQSGTIFIDDHAPVLDWLKLDDDTTLIQLWHAGAGFKSSGYSPWGHEGCPLPQSCHRQYKYGIAGSKNIAPFFSEVWGINDEQVLPTGMPRMDEYLDEQHRNEKIKEVYEQFRMCRGKKVILFAPTYRGRNKKTAYYPYELIDFEKLYQICGDEYVVLFKMHPWVNKDIVIGKKYADKFLDVKKYPNINDLFYIVDLLITDYSSNIFEYSLMRKPMLFFAFDKIQYSFSRGFHRDYEESAPGKVCYSFEEVLSAITDKDFEYEKVEQYITHHFDYIDSGASDRVIDWILLGKMPENISNAIKKKQEEIQRMHELDFATGMLVQQDD